MADDSKATNPKDAAATTRLDLSLVPDSAVAACALAFVEGDLKYGGFNWRVAGVQASVYVAALRRHVAKWYNGEDDDPKTLVPHLANAIACLAVLIDAIEQGQLNDDRPPKQSSVQYADAEKIVAHLQKIFPRKAKRNRADDSAASIGPMPGILLTEEQARRILNTEVGPMSEAPRKDPRWPWTP